MEVKYAIRQVCVGAHSSPAYLQNSEYGLQFTYGAFQPYDIYYFDTKELAIAYIAEHLHYQYVEIVEVYVKNK